MGLRMKTLPAAPGGAVPDGGDQHQGGGKTGGGAEQERRPRVHQVPEQAGDETGEKGDDARNRLVGPQGGSPRSRRREVRYVCLSHQIGRASCRERV